jgi:hypothetical protein
VKPEAARFVEEMLCLIRREFFAKHEHKRFFQERPTLIQAITWPARWMNERGVKARPDVYRGILRTVIKTIRERGNVSQIRRFSVYFLHSVQAHIKHWLYRNASALGHLFPRGHSTIGLRIHCRRRGSNPHGLAATGF